MKPDFALLLSHDGIGLVHRRKSDWVSLGTAALEDSDLTQALKALRAKARNLAPKGLASKLVIPDSQILYMPVDAPGPSDAQRRRQIIAALDGVTPYAVNDLVFDWALDEDGQVLVAIVARETLNEAESFADSHGFCPVSFVADPETVDYPGEPWFGLTGVAPKYLTEGVRLDRDDAPIGAAGRRLPVPEDIDEAADPSDAAEQISHADAPLIAPDPEPAPATEAASGDETVIDAQADDAPPEPAPDASAPPAKTDDAALDTADAAEPETITEAGDSPAIPPVDDLAASQDALPTFSSRRGVDASDQAPNLSGLGHLSLPTAPDAPDTDTDNNTDEESAAVLATPAPTVAPAAPRKPAGDSELLTVFGAPKRPAARLSSRKRVIALAAVAAVLLALIGLWVGFLSRDTAPAPEDRTAAQIAPATETTAPQSATVAQAPVEPATQPTAEPTPDDTITATASTKTPAPATAQNDTDSADTPAQGSQDAAETSVVAALPPLTATPLTPPQPSADTAAPEAAMPPFTATPLPVPTIAAPEAAQSAELPPFTATPLPPPQIAPPAAPAQPDAQPVTPTREGVAMPGGFTLFSGKPPVVPSPRPDTVRQAALAARPPAPLRPEDTLGALPDLAAFRPTPRPETLVPAPQQAAPEAPATTTPSAVAPPPAAPTTTPPADPALAGKRPAARPDTVIAAAKSAANPFASATPLAVAQSPRPGDKPNNFSRIVRDAIAAATATPDPTPPAAAAPAPAPQAQPDPIDEPEPEAPAPSLPTSASVAKQATEKNVLNLRKINLIGLYGSSSDRRALVRLANGKFVKVSVGDRLDGGKVTAIGSGQLSYKKGSRTVVLKLLEGG